MGRAVGSGDRRIGAGGVGVDIGPVVGGGGLVGGVYDVAASWGRGQSPSLIVLCLELLVT